MPAGNYSSNSSQFDDSTVQSFHQEASFLGGSPVYSYPSSKVPFRLTKSRWLALALMNLLIFGYLSVFDSPQPLESAILKAFDIDEDEYSLLYTYLAAPNIILPVFAGMLVDYLGVRPSLIIFGSLVLIGQLIFALGGQLLNFSVMILGRVVYSLGADPLNIAQVVIVNKWFKGKELALAISLGTLMAGGGKAFCSAVIPLVYEMAQNIHVPLYFGAFVCFLSLICVFIVVVWDIANDEREKAYDSNFGKQHAEGEKFKLSDLKKFGLLAWLLVINYGILDGTIFTLRSYLNEFYKNSFHFTEVEAGYYISSHYMTMAISSPIMGFFIDKIGLRASITFYNSILGVIGFVIYIIYPETEKGLLPLVPLVLFGLYLGIDDATVFAALPLVLDEKLLGTGYGLFYVFENIVLTFLPPITGKIANATAKRQDGPPNIPEGYKWASVFLGAWAVIGCIESLMLLIADKMRGGILDKTVANSDPPKNEDENRLLDHDAQAL